MRITFLALVALLGITGCSPPSDSWSAEVHGVQIYYQVTDLGNTLGYASPRPGWCLVQISSDLDYHRIVVPVVAHEVGHCLDFFRLTSTHNGFGDGEGYANAYSSAYISACGFDGFPLGWSNEGEPCTPPLPRSVIPD